MIDNTETGVFQKFFNFSLAEIIQNFLIVLFLLVRLFDLLQSLPVRRSRREGWGSLLASQEVGQEGFLSFPFAVSASLRQAVVLNAELQLELPQQVLNLQ